MGVWDLFSKRQRRARGEFPDVYQYATLSPEFRAQTVHILSDTIGKHLGEPWEFMHHTLSKEYGVLGLPGPSAHTPPIERILNHVIKGPTEQVLDVIEIGLLAAKVVDGDYGKRKESRATQTAADATTEFNTRFREHGIGYQVENQKIIRVDSQVLHAEVVKPALSLLAAPAFAGPNAEFLSAHEHYRHARYGSSMNESLKALESTLKVICSEHEWPHGEHDTAKALLNVVFANNLIPSWMQAQFGGLRSMLESGVPTARNRVSGHGQGTEVREVPAYLAAYLLHSTAAAIVMLVGANNLQAA